MGWEGEERRGKERTRKEGRERKVGERREREGGGPPNANSRIRP